jgi:hypothetical protein
MLTLGSGLVFLFFAGVSLVHFLGLYRIASLLRPDLVAPAFVVLLFLWVVVLGLLLWGRRYRRLSLASGIICAYAILFIVLSLVKFLPGVPARVSQGHWRDPHGLIKPDSEYLIHNHSVVLQVISRDEYLAYSMMVLAYFTSFGMVFSVVALTWLVDRHRQKP